LSPLRSEIVLDNTVISSLYVAGALTQILEVRAGRWVVPLQVRDEAAAWHARGTGVLFHLNSLDARGVVVFVSPAPGPEGALFAALTRTRGRGESAAIAIAHSRGLVVATDDRQARRSCAGLNPPVPTLSTEGLLSRIVIEGLIAETTARAIWTATGIRDPNRGIRL
jgi:predicted nucleic acid-binding protein